MTNRSPVLKRILLKLSGESFGTKEPFELSIIESIVEEISKVYHQGVQMGIVMGGGNIVRGAMLENRGILRNSGDDMGMLATVINALALRELLKAKDVKSCIVTARAVEGIGECYNHERCVHLLEQGSLILFAAGTGHPYFTTDTAAALRAVEIGAQCLLKGTKVDGVYDGVENIGKTQKFDYLTYEQVLSNRYRVMDLTAVAFCMEYQLPIRVFNLMKPENLLRVVYGESVGTLIGK